MFPSYFEQSSTDRLLSMRWEWALLPGVRFKIIEEITACSEKEDEFESGICHGKYTGTHAILWVERIRAPRNAL